jgi:cytochrome c-type biogenesis protein CcmF
MSLGNLGNILMLICLLASLIQALYLIYPHTSFGKININYRVLTRIIFITCLASFLLLIYLFLESNFNYQLVVNNSHSEKPLIYKIAGAWGNHEGSLLLWILVLSFFNFVFLETKIKNTEFKKYVISFQSLMIFGFTLFLLLTSNPFLATENITNEGLGLNPILQDLLLAIHPPILYVGYVGYSIVLSFAVGGMITNKIDQEWARWLHPWVIVSWIFLTAGIGLGSFWAYYELGWGGYWFWDPVENASLMPWLAGTALFHCVIILEKKNILQSWVILLSILTFSLSLIGTFLVRSGILNSVHTFASDPSRGLFILVFLAIILIISFTLYAIKAPTLDKKSKINIVSKEAGILANNWLLLSSLFVVFLGTLYPLAVDLFLQKSISVGPNYYVLSLMPILLLLLLIMIVGPVSKWQNDKLTNILFSISKLFILSLAIIFAFSIYFSELKLTQITLLTLCLTLMLVSIKNGIRTNRNYSIISPSLGKSLAHIGFGLLILSVIANTTFATEKIFQAQVDDLLVIDNYKFKFDKVNQTKGKNFNAVTATFSLLDNKTVIETFKPEIRIYSNPPTVTSETSIVRKFLADIYIVMNIPENADFVNVRIHIKPMMSFIWFSIILMVLGGISSIFFRIKLIK